MNLSQLIEQYIAFRKSLGEIQATNAQTLRMFGRFIGIAADVAEVRSDQVSAFLAGKGQRTLTWHHKLGVLRSFYRYAVSRDYVPSAPLPTVTGKEPMFRSCCRNSPFIWGTSASGTPRSTSA